MSGVETLDTTGERFIASWEGGQSSDGLYRAYWDSYGKVWTIGIGQTHDVREGMVWTQAQAYADLEHSFATSYGPYINALGVPFNQNQFNAVGDAVWNLGPGSLAWDWGRAIKAGDWHAASELILNYDSAGGVVLGGLVTRRRAESALMMTPVVVPTTNPYLIYPDQLLTYGGWKFNERKLAKRVDEGLLHPKLHHHELVEDLPRAAAAKDRLWVVSVYQAPAYKTKRVKPDWSNDRGERYQRWASRIKAMTKALS